MELKIQNTPINLKQVWDFNFNNITVVNHKRFSLDLQTLRRWSLSVVGHEWIKSSHLTNGVTMMMMRFARLPPGHRWTTRLCHLQLRLECETICWVWEILTTFMTQVPLSMCTTKSPLDQQRQLTTIPSETSSFDVPPHHFCQQDSHLEAEKWTAIFVYIVWAINCQVISLVQIIASTCCATQVASSEFFFFRNQLLATLLYNSCLVVGSW